VVFCDEPTGNLDETNANELFEVIREETIKGRSAVIVSHDINLALKHADLIVVLTKNNEKKYGELLIDNIFERETWEKKNEIETLPNSEYGALINSENYNGKPSEEAREELIKFVTENKIGNKKINFKLRDWVFSRQRYWGEPIPLIHLEDGTIIEEENLPVVLPEVPDYTPTSDASSPLAKNAEWVNVEVNGKKGKREIEK
jgi:leucyl-tRNA synthetase